MTGPPNAVVDLTVSTVDADSGQPVAGVFYFEDDDNSHGLATNIPHRMTLYQEEDTLDLPNPVTHQPFYFSPSVQVKVEGYEEVSLSLD